MTTNCDCCNVVVKNTEELPHNIDITATTNALIKRVENAQMRVLRGDCPLEEMVDLLVADTKYTIVQFLRCNKCNRVIFWGLCIRGAPTYKFVEENAPQKWNWT